MKHDRPTIIGHRGAAGLAPENSIEAFQLAYRLGVRYIELDVRLSRDRKAVVIHDATIDRTTTGTGRVEDLSLDEIGAFQLRGTRSASARIPDLLEALDCVPDAANWLLELKPEPGSATDLVREVIRSVASRQAGPRVRLISFDRQVLAIARDLAPEVRRGVLDARDARLATCDATELACSAVLLQHELVTTDVVAHTRTTGLQLAAWTVNSRVTVQELVDLGVDGIVSDYPDMASIVASGAEPPSEPRE